MRAMRLVSLSKLRFWAGIATVAALAGCAGQPKATLPLDREFYEVERKEGFRTEGYRGTEPSVIRTFAGPRGRQEISVADCILLSETYSVQFSSPARILVPDYGPSSPEPVVACTHNGQRQAALLDVRQDGHNTSNTRHRRRSGGFLTVGVGANVKIDEPAAAAVAVATVASLIAISALSRRGRGNGPQSLDRVNLVFD